MDNLAMLAKHDLSPPEWTTTVWFHQCVRVGGWGQMSSRNKKVMGSLAQLTAACLQYLHRMSKDFPYGEQNGFSYWPEVWERCLCHS